MTSPKRASRRAPAAAGWFVAVAALFVFLLYGVYGLYNCDGGSCRAALALVFVPTLTAAVVGPVVGGSRGERELFVGVTVALGALTALALVYQLTFGGVWNTFLFLVVPALLFLTSLVLTLRRST